MKKMMMAIAMVLMTATAISAQTSKQHCPNKEVKQAVAECCETSREVKQAKKDYKEACKEYKKACKEHKKACEAAKKECKKAKNECEKAKKECKDVKKQCEKDVQCKKEALKSNCCTK